MQVKQYVAEPVQVVQLKLQTVHLLFAELPKKPVPQSDIHLEVLDYQNRDPEQVRQFVASGPEHVVQVDSHEAQATKPVSGY